MAGLHGRLRPAGPRNRASRWRACCGMRASRSVCLRKEKCTGDPARRLGNDLAFSQIAEQNIETLRAAKVGKMVSICPHCVRTIGTDWREAGADVRDRAPQRAARADPRSAARGGRIARQSVVFHDPCYLGRYRNVYEEPRAVAGNMEK